MQAIEYAVIAAAGMGTRLGAGIPKCLVKVAGRRIIDYQLELLREIPCVFIVTGFREREVIEYISHRRPDVIFVRNAAYRHTKTLASYYLAGRVLREKAVFLDGDMIIEQQSFRAFLQKAAEEEALVGVTKRLSDDPVYADVRREAGKCTIRGFGYDSPSPFEWANVACLPPGMLRNGKTHVFEFLQGQLPLPAAVLDRLEIDTPEDLAAAERELRDNPRWREAWTCH